MPGWTPSVTLEVRDDVETGEEMEERLYTQRSKLYRFRDGDWKERGTGEAKLLKDPVTGRVRFLLRQEKTMKIVANHCVFDYDEAPYCVLRPNANSERCWVWTAPDCADGGEQQVEQFALKFGTPELAKEFKEAFDKAKRSARTGSGAPATKVNAEDAMPPTVRPDDPDEEEGDDSTDSEESYTEEVVVEGNSPTDAAGTSKGGTANWTCLQSIADQQASGQWRCPNCRLLCKDDVFECAVCEIPRPGFEDLAERSKKEKQQGQQAAVDAFLSKSGGGGGGASSSSGFNLFSAPPVGSGPLFGGATIPQFGDARSMAAASGASGSAPSTGGLFGASTLNSASLATPTPSAASASSVFGSGAVPSFCTVGGSSIFGGGGSSGAAPALASSGGTPLGFGGPAGAPVGLATTWASSPTDTGGGLFGARPGPTPPAMPAAPPAPLGTGGGLDIQSLAAMIAAAAASNSTAAAGGSTGASSAETAASLRRAEEQAQRAIEQARRVADDVEELKDRCRKAEEHARRAEDRAKSTEASQEDLTRQVAELKRCVESMRQRHQDDSEAVHRLSERQSVSAERIARLEEELRRERMASRTPLELGGPFQEAVDRALKTAQDSQKAVADVDRHSRERCDELESTMRQFHAEHLKNMSAPDRIMFFQGLHKKRLAGAAPQLALEPAEREATRGTVLGLSGSMLRRVG